MGSDASMRILADFYWSLRHLKTAIAAREAAMKAIIMYSAMVDA